MNAIRRLGFALLGLVYLLWGAWATAVPEHFFVNFPGLGARRWTAAYPPYNEHLVTDLGATFVLIGALLVAVAIVDQQGVTWVVAGGVTLFNGLHLWYHVNHHGDLRGEDYRESLITLIVGVALPPLLAVTHRR